MFHVFCHFAFPSSLFALYIRGAFDLFGMYMKCTI